MSEVDHLAETLAENVWEIISFDYLLVKALVHDKKQVETAFTTIDYSYLVVSPLVVEVLIQRVGELVGHIDELDAPLSPFQEEWKFNRIVGRKRY